MARSHSRASRSFLPFVLVAVLLAAAFQFYRIQQAKAADAARAVTLAKKAPAVVEPVIAKPDIGPMMAGITPVAPEAPVRAPLPAASLSNNAAQALVTPSTRPVALIEPMPVNGARSTHAAIVATTSDNPAADAKSRLAAGDLIGGRRLLNDSLASSNFAGPDADSLKKQISDINQTLVFSPRHFADDPYGGTYQVKPGQRLSQIATECQVTWQLLCRLNGLSDPRKLKAGQSLKIIRGPLNAVVTKSKFTLDIYAGSPGGQGSMYITTFNVGLGKDDSTPTGTWTIKDKVKHPTYYSPRGEGVIAADDPKNPLGPFWLGLAGTDGHAVGKNSYGIHGTIEPDSIGKMSSMGCIRLRNEDIAVVFELLIEGKSSVIVKD